MRGSFKTSEVLALRLRNAWTFALEAWRRAERQTLLPPLCPAFTGQGYRLAGEASVALRAEMPAKPGLKVQK